MAGYTIRERRGRGGTESRHVRWRYSRRTQTPLFMRSTARIGRQFSVTYWLENQTSAGHIVDNRAPWKKFETHELPDMAFITNQDVWRATCESGVLLSRSCRTCSHGPLKATLKREGVLLLAVECWRHGRRPAWKSDARRCVIHRGSPPFATYPLRPGEGERWALGQMSRRASPAALEGERETGGEKVNVIDPDDAPNMKSRSRAADFFTLSQTRSVQRLQAIVKHFTSKFHSNNTA